MGSSEMRGRFQAFLPVHELAQGKARWAHIQKATILKPGGQLTGGEFFPLITDVFNSVTRLLCPWNFAGKNTGVGCHFFLQGIFPTQGSNSSLLGLLHHRQILHLLSHWRSPNSISNGESFPEGFQFTLPRSIRRITLCGS